MVPSQVVPGAEDWLPRVSGNPARATSLETEPQTHLELSEEQQLQVGEGLWGRSRSREPKKPLAASLTLVTHRFLRS